MTLNDQQYDQIRTGAVVYGAEGDEVGTVRELRSNDMLVERPIQPSIYIPFTAIQRAIEDRVWLNVAAVRVDDMDWPGANYDNGRIETGSASQHDNA